MRILIRAIVGLTLLAYASLLPAKTQWHWDDRFSEQEKSGLTAWIEQSMGGLGALFGEVPQTWHVHFLRHPASEPVPWAETNKGRGPRVYFHVDTRHPWSAFRQDWTAPHELSHLLFPYLGEDSRWFAEGIASYLQYQVMYANGVLSWKQAIARYADRFRSARSDTNSGDLSIVEQGERGGGYVRLYWGGAAYFLHADRALFLGKGKRLNDIIRLYMACCYEPFGVDARGMIREFDRLSESRIFSDAYAQTVAAPGFPDTDEALEWLQQHPPLTR